jgi:hypothetical protein
MAIGRSGLDGGVVAGEDDSVVGCRGELFPFPESEWPAWSSWINSIQLSWATVLAFLVLHEFRSHRDFRIRCIFVLSYRRTQFAIQAAQTFYVEHILSDIPEHATARDHDMPANNLSAVFRRT